MPIPISFSEVGQKEANCVCQRPCRSNSFRKVVFSEGSFTEFVINDERCFKEACEFDRISEQFVINLT